MSRKRDPLTNPDIDSGDGVPGDGVPSPQHRDGHYSDVRPLLFGDLWDYAPAPETADHVQFQSRYGHFIGGEFVEGENHVPTINPATEEVLAEVARFYVDVAVAAIGVAPGHSMSDRRPDEGYCTLFDEFGLEAGFCDSRSDGRVLAENFELMGRADISIEA